ncbi:MAG TPA: glycosyltransferase family 1 protein [Thermoleophilaceae bacterium]|nr:glycosyltransferase family 1 protein [Thermoleophilaceae bacterium]
MEVYARELIPRLAAVEGLRLTAFVNREAAAGEPGPWHAIPHETVPVDARSRFQWVWGEQRHLPRMAARAGCDLVHSLASTAPVWGRFKRVTTVHDLNYKMVPEAHFGLLRLGMGVLVPAAARRSQRVIVDAASTAVDVERHLGVPRAKIDVVPLGVGQQPAVAPTPEPELRAKLDLGDRPILLTASAKRPHKNLMRLLEAHAKIGAAERPMLVLPGYSTPHEADLIGRAAYLGTSDQVRFPDWVDQADLEGLYAAATAFVFPSLYEGFGLPVLEAMRRGVPVACSNRSSLPEVAGDAALTFDPEDGAAIGAAIVRLLKDEPLRARLRRDGPAQAGRFDWEATASATLAVYERALAG